MTNPYKLELDFPHCINVSGGKSSAYMLHKIIGANGFNRVWPETIVPIFTNTGKEMPQTYDFLHEMEKRWHVPLVWLELSAYKGSAQSQTHPCLLYTSPSARDS